MSFTVGDTVYLRSGSVAMTLVKQEDKNWVCQWSRGQDLTTANIPEAALITTDPRPGINKAERERREAVDPAPIEPKPEA